MRLFYWQTQFLPIMNIRTRLTACVSLLWRLSEELLIKISSNFKQIVSLCLSAAPLYTMYNPEASINVKSNLAARSSRGGRPAQPGSGVGESPAPSDWLWLAEAEIASFCWDVLLPLSGQSSTGTLLFSSLVSFAHLVHHYSQQTPSPPTCPGLALRPDTNSDHI